MNKRKQNAQSEKKLGERRWATLQNKEEYKEERKKGGKGRRKQNNVEEDKQNRLKEK